jgi:predicted secreted protein
MSWETALAYYLIVWWLVFFCVLPIGVLSHAEAGVKPPAGADPASPVDPKLKKKFITTTWVSALVCAPFALAFQMHWISLDMLRHFP